LYQVAADVRLEFEQARVDRERLARLYSAYNPIRDIALFVERALGLYPHLCCGLASLYLRQRLGNGVVHCGSYGGTQHTFLVAHGLLLDITCDQFGGPRIYVGPVAPPWRVDRCGSIGVHGPQNTA
jgi:hypothetical protein